MKKLRTLSFLLLPAVLAPAAARAQDNFELGRMWTFEKPPLAYLEKEYGFKPTEAWLQAVRLASLRFGGGCSASFVSPRGLIMTNHHCVRGEIAKVQGEHDWVKNGFVAADYKDEVRLPGLTVQQLVATHDITADVEAGVEAADDADTVERKRAANREHVLAAAKGEHPDQQHQIVKLFEGAIYELYSYKIYRDIRLVCSPHLQTSHFGGDPDNFTYPRFGIDFSFCRAYEDGKPADTSAHYFKWNKSGVKEGQLVFVTGNPGSTERLLTEAQLEHLRDARYPFIRELIDDRIDIMRKMASKDAEAEKALRTTILSYENSQKAYGGMHKALLDDHFMALKKKAEKAFRDRIAADPELEKKYGDVWDKLAEVAHARIGLEFPLRFQSPGGSVRLARALLLVRAANGDEQAKAQLARIPMHMSQQQIDFFIDHLRRAQHHLPADDPFLKAVLAGDTPEQAWERLQKSQIGDQGFVDKILAGGAKAVEDSDDPALRVARVLDPLVRANQEANDKLDSREAVLGTRLGQALFAAYGQTVSPDATFTLRFSDGRVKGYPYNGTVAPFRTCFYGLYARNAEFDNVHPFDMPKIWLDAVGDIDMTKSVDFVCTVDTTGGNSGSPVINKDREIVGLLFDGNIESLANDFLFREDVPRSVCVHVDGIMEALQKIYHADRLVDELVGP